MQKRKKSILAGIYLSLISVIFLSLLSSATPGTHRIPAVDSSVFRYIGGLMQEG